MTSNRRRPARQPALPADIARLVAQRRQDEALRAAIRDQKAQAFRRIEAAYYAKRDVMAEWVAPHRVLAEYVLDGRVPFHEAYKRVVEASPDEPTPEGIADLVRAMDRLRNADDIAEAHAEQIDWYSHRAKFALAREMGVLQAYCG